MVGLDLEALFKPDDSVIPAQLLLNSVLFSGDGQQKNPRNQQVAAITSKGEKRVRKISYEYGFVNQSSTILLSKFPNRTRRGLETPANLSWIHGLYLSLTYF